MRQLYLSAGHSNMQGRDQGAEGNNYIEGQLAAEFRDLLSDKLIEKGIQPILDPDSNITKETVALFKTKVKPNDIAIDIHFNAATPQATGCESIMPKSFSPFERDLASSLSLIMSNVLDLKNRGVFTEDKTPRKKLAWMTLNCETVLIEICFISNVNDMNNYQLYKDELAEKMSYYLSKLLVK